MSMPPRSRTGSGALLAGLIIALVVAVSIILLAASGATPTSVWNSFFPVHNEGGVTDRSTSVQGLYDIVFYIAVVMLPHQALVNADAIVRTLYRVVVSRNHLLEWQTASQVEQSSHGGRSIVWSRMWPAVAVALVVLVAMWSSSIARHDGFGSMLLLAFVTLWWLSARFTSEWLETDMRRRTGFIRCSSSCTPNSH